MPLCGFFLIIAQFFYLVNLQVKTDSVDFYGLPPYNTIKNGNEELR